MYISNIQLKNWRSYAEGEFSFVRPSNRKPLVLIGAMNGHGKTSFLFALYMGLFGRFGLRHAEGFQNADLEDVTFYREAIRRFRRSNAEPDEPTSVEIVFSPTASEAGVAEIRVVRRWFFTATGQPRQGEGFETVDLYVDGKPQKLHTGLDAAIARLERLLFRADIMPAFFFDGEQAQTLITSSGQDGMKKAVEVLFGTKVVEEALDHVKQFVQTSHSKVGGKKNSSAQQAQLDDKIERRCALERELAELEGGIRKLQKQREQNDSEQRRAQEALALKGGERKADLVQAHADVDKCALEIRNAEKSLTESVKKLGLSLGLSRLAPAITNRLEAESARENWENLRDGTLSRTGEVLDLALPEPPDRDLLLGNLSAEVRLKVRDRFRTAIEHIYNPPPTDCAAEYLLGHVKGEARNKLLVAVTAAKSQGIADIKSRARRLGDAKQQLEDAFHRRDSIGNLPAEVEDLSLRLTEIGEQISEASRQLGAKEHQLRSLRSELQDVNAEIGRLQEALAKLGPEQKRIAVAERIRNVLSALGEQFRPITVNRLQSSVTSHFMKIADSRYKGGSIVFSEGGSPVLKRQGLPDALIETMSGFERRAFGISFSLALAEITRKRVPLVIDTPLGNADQSYRRRLLKALVNVDLDQIVILTHDAEVAGGLFEEIESQVKQTFLVEFDPAKHESIVNQDAYFEGVGR